MGAQEEAEGGVWLVQRNCIQYFLSACNRLLMGILTFRCRTMDFWAETWGSCLYSCWMPTSSEESQGKICRYMLD